MYAKKDVKGASRLIWVRDTDVFIMAVEKVGDDALCVLFRGAREY